MAFSKQSVFEFQAIGIEQTAVALASWKAHYGAALVTKEDDIKNAVLKAIRQITELGHSRSQSFQPVSDVTKLVRVGRGSPSPGRDEPFSSRGNLIKTLRVQTNFRKSAFGRQEAMTTQVVVDVPDPADQKWVAGLVFGWSRTVDEATSKAILALTEGQVFIPPGHVMSAPGRDFMAAGMEDAMPEIQKIYQIAVSQASATTEMAMPLIKTSKTTRGAVSRPRSKTGLKKRSGWRVSRKLNSNPESF